MLLFQQLFLHLRFVLNLVHGLCAGSSTGVNNLSEDKNRNASSDRIKNTLKVTLPLYEQTFSLQFLNFLCELYDIFISGPRTKKNESRKFFEKQHH